MTGCGGSNVSGVGAGARCFRHKKNARMPITAIAKNAPMPIPARAPPERPPPLPPSEPVFGPVGVEGEGAEGVVGADGRGVVGACGGKEGEERDVMLAVGIVGEDRMEVTEAAALIVVVSAPEELSHQTAVSGTWLPPPAM